ncbi:hypothetical protein [Pseudoalteromonas sp. Of11M-6]|uniref:hypothetical protein n=1 Tax=Pseudoalteromonas sp. Of11M-6 TaxID=2917754 RepID=UPI001EF53CEF|nr:hypothetical protein [Pseudoalteromonas sp. Of11M-6]MCG7552755.1 hypothetical protein [Pseudoalteromonas sp. Of11M-6]
MTAHVGYHTCKLENGFDYIVDNIPFRSGNGANQWLTQGYYFWTDSDYWAKKWGVSNRRVIGQFNINLCFKKEVLDLVGNVQHQLEFIQLKDTILAKLDKEEIRKSVTVNQILSKLRCSKEIFPYLGVRAQDGRREEQIDFVDPKINRSKLGLVTPQQLCVFEEAKDRIFLNGFIEPSDFAEKMPTA